MASSFVRAVDLFVNLQGVTKVQGITHVKHLDGARHRVNAVTVAVLLSVRLPILSGHSEAALSELNFCHGTQVLDLHRPQAQLATRGY